MATSAPSLVRSTVVIGALTLLSRVLGFVREALIARALGAGWVSDCFFVAFKLPNLFRRLFAEGAFSAAFVPLVSRTIGEAKGDTRAAVRFGEDTLSVFLIFLTGFSALAMIVMPMLVLAMTGGFKDPVPGQFDVAVTLSRLTFPYLMLISITSLLGGVLNALSRFSAAAAAPIMLNICMIGAVLLVDDGGVESAIALSVGVTLAGATQMIWLLWSCHRAGVHLRLRWPRLTPKVRQFGRVVLPAALGQGAMQINLLVDTFIATRFLEQGSLSFIYYADRLNQLPLGVVGVAVGTALLPTLSRLLGENKTEGANILQNRSIELALLLALPAALALIALAEPIVRISYERGAFGAADTLATSQALVAFACGLPAYILIKVLTPGFFARQDTATPVKIAIVAMVVNFLLNITLVWQFRHVGLAASTAIAAWVNAGLLYWVLRKRGHFRVDRQLLVNTMRIFICALGMALFCAGAAWWARDWLAEQGLHLLLALGTICGIAVIGYFSGVIACGAISWADLKRRLRRRKASSM
jgi:putative peptidoglycan lipid II flippase